MTVDTIQAGGQSTYTLRDGAGPCCQLAFSGGQGGPTEWQIVLPATGASDRRDVQRRFAAPGAVQLRTWLAAIIGAGWAAELAAAVAARPPWPPGRQPYAPPATGLTIPRQRDHRAA